MEPRRGYARFERAAGRGDRSAWPAILGAMIDGGPADRRPPLRAMVPLDGENRYRGGSRSLIAPPGGRGPAGRSPLPGEYCISYFNNSI